MRPTLVVVGSLVPILFTLLLSGVAYGEETPRAYLGNNSGGANGLRDPELAGFYQDTRRLAESYGHEFIRPEHILIVLLDVPSVSELLVRTGSDTGALRSRGFPRLSCSSSDGDRRGDPPLYQ